jgi:nitronate monooxygenase
MRASSQWKTSLCDLLGCDVPIIQAGMGGVARSELVAAVLNAGGYGLLGMVREKPELIRREIKAVRDRTDRAFGVNLIPYGTDPALLDEELAACLEERVHALCFFWEVRPDVIRRVKAAGCKALYQVGRLEDAVAAEWAGADAIICQGSEAGGHVHGTVSSLVLLPQVANAVSVPVAASGGFATGSGLVAALALGAQGIHCGTAFLATEESFAHDLHKRRVVQARSEDTIHTDIFAINWPPRSPVRVLKNSVTEGWTGPWHGHGPDDFPRTQVAEEEGRPVYRFSTDSPLRNMRGDLEQLAFFAGECCGLIERVKPAGEVVASIMQEAAQVLARLKG